MNTNNDTNTKINYSIAYKLVNGEGEYTVSANGNEYTVYQDQKGNLSVNPRLKGKALEEAQKAIGLVKELQQRLAEEAQKAIQEVPLQEQQAKQPKEVRKLHPFYPPYVRFLEATKLDSENTTLSKLEKNIDDFLKNTFAVIGLSVIKDLSAKLKTLSAERKEKIEGKFWGIRKFFHKLNQMFKGGGFRTLAERADGLRNKIDGLIPELEKRAEQEKRENLRWKLTAIAKDTGYGNLVREDTIKEINALDKEAFIDVMSVYFSNDQFVSAHTLYRELNDEKRKLFDDLLLVKPDWNRWANLHFSQSTFNPVGNVWEIDGFDKERYLAKFVEDYKRIFRTEQDHYFNSNAHYNIIFSLQGLHTDGEKFSLEKFEGLGLKLPKYVSNTFVQYLFREAVIQYVQKDNWSKVTSLLDALNIKNTYGNPAEGQILKTMVEITLNEILNKDNLPEAIVKAIKENMLYEEYGLFPETVATAAQ